MWTVGESKKSPNPTHPIRSHPILPNPAHDVRLTRETKHKMKYINLIPPYKTRPHLPGIRHTRHRNGCGSLSGLSSLEMQAEGPQCYACGKRASEQASSKKQKNRDGADQPCHGHAQATYIRSTHPEEEKKNNTQNSDTLKHTSRNKHPKDD